MKGRTMDGKERLHQGLSFTWTIWYSTCAVSTSCCIRSNPDYLPLLHISLSHPCLLSLHYSGGIAGWTPESWLFNCRVCVFHTLPLSGDALVNKQIMGYANCMDLKRKGRHGFSPLPTYQPASWWPRWFMRHSVQAASNAPLPRERQVKEQCSCHFQNLGCGPLRKVRGRKDLPTGDTLDHKIKQAPHCQVFSTRPRGEKYDQKVWSRLRNAYKRSTWYWNSPEAGTVVIHPGTKKDKEVI